ncbi:MAG: hypothetical protein QM330_05875 [Acidobacteriota bacterium]|jgi:hypothetical protein|nr:hypothetical protein [Acidobacteriota bacterium]
MRIPSRLQDRLNGAQRTEWNMKATAEPTPVGSDSGKAREGIKEYSCHHRSSMLSANAEIVQAVIFIPGLQKGQRPVNLAPVVYR